jgi:hypothetical protein
MHDTFQKIFFILKYIKIQISFLFLTLKSSKNTKKKKQIFF